MGGDAYYIVEKLNAAPFKIGLNFLTFSEKTPNQLIEILGDVCAAISPKHARRGGAGSYEALDSTVERILSFLRVVKYKPQADPASFRQLLAAGDREVVHPLLRWLLAQAPLLQKRAYVGYYLTMPEMPDDLAYDPGIADLKAAIKELQPAFIEAHKAAEAARSAAEELPAFRSLIKQLEEEKERLAEKVERARAQVSALPHAGSYAELCIALRQQHDEEVSISTTLQSQSAALERAQAAHAQAAARLDRASGGIGAGAVGGDALVGALTEEVARLRQQVDKHQPEEMEARQRRLAALQEALSIEVSGEAGLQRLAAQAAALQQSVSDASSRLAAAERARQADRAYLQVRQAQQMAAVTAKRRAELEARLDRLSRAREALLASLGEQEGRRAAAGAGGGARGAVPGGGAVSDADWKAKYDSVKGKLADLKVMKKELAALEAEAFVLARTETLLVAQENEARGRAPSGGSASPGQEASGAAAAAGGHYPGGLEYLREAIAAKKADLAPKVQQLRAARERYQVSDARLAAAREAHASTVGPLEQRCAALESEVAALQREVDEGQEALVSVNAVVAGLDASLRRLAQEPGGAEKLRERCQQGIAQAELELRQLKERQRTLAAAASRGHAQSAAMRDLERVLAAKLRAARGGAAGGSGEGGTGGGGGAPQAGGGAAASFRTATANVAVF